MLGVDNLGRGFRYTLFSKLLCSIIIMVFGEVLVFKAEYGRVSVDL